MFDSRFKILRVKDLIDMLGVSRSTLWRMEKNGLLPPRRKISTRAVGWLLADIESFIKQLGVTD